MFPSQAASHGRTAGERGILAQADRLEMWLHITFVLLTLASAARYVQGHGLADNAAWILSGAGLLLLVYGFPWLLGSRRVFAPVWCGALIVLWFVLVLLAPSFAWVAVPLSFTTLRVLPFPAAGGILAAMMVAVVVAWTSMQGGLDPTVAVGPICIAVLTVVAYRALDREAVIRQRLIDELREAQDELAAAQHRAGVLAERGRLSREIHDSVAQELSSINLLLRAADLDWSARPAAARVHVEKAAQAARDGLDEVRRLIRDLAPAELSTDPAGSALVAALERSSQQAVVNSGVAVAVSVHGDPEAVPAAVAMALLRTARGAMANVVEHAEASTATVTLTYLPDSVTLDVRDDGKGFPPDHTATSNGRGHGIGGIRDRVRELDGDLTVESGPGEGTTIAVSIPLPPSNARVQPSNARVQPSNAQASNAQASNAQASNAQPTDRTKLNS